MTLHQTFWALTFGGLLLLCAGSGFSAHPLAVPEAREPTRVLVRKLEELHSAAERRGPSVPVRERVLFSLLHHVAEDARALHEAVESERQPHQAVIAKLAHLQGWFDYLEPRLRASMLGSSLWDGWSGARQQLTQVATIVLGRTNSDIDAGAARRRRLDASALEKLPVPADFQRVVDQERNAGAIPDASHIGGSPGPDRPPADRGGAPGVGQWNFNVPH